MATATVTNGDAIVVFCSSNASQAIHVHERLAVVDELARCQSHQIDAAVFWYYSDDFEHERVHLHDAMESIRCACDPIIITEDLVKNGCYCVLTGLVR